MMVVRLGILCALILIGCTPHRAKIEACKSRTEEAWWRVFNDPLMDILDEFLLKSSPDIAYAQEQLHQSLALTGVSYSALLPQANMSATYYNGSNASYGFVAKHIESVGLQSSWNVDVFGASRAQYAASKAMGQYYYENVKAIQESQRNILFLSLLQWRQAYETMHESKILLHDQEKQVAIYQAKVDAGLLDASYLSRAKALYYEPSTLIPVAEVSMKKAQNNIEKLLNVGYGELDSLMQRYEGPIHLPSKKELPEVNEEFLANSYTILAYKAKVEAAYADVQFARANRWPQINMNSFWGYYRGSGSLSIPHRPIETFTMNILQPLINYGSLNASLEAAESAYIQARLAYDIKRFSVMQAVQDAKVTYQSYRKIIYQQSEALRYRKEAVRIKAQRFEDGLDDMVDLTTTQTELNQSTLSYINYKAHAAAAYMHFMYSTGGMARGRIELPTRGFSVHCSTD